MANDIGQVARFAETDFDGIKAGKFLSIERSVTEGGLCFSTASGGATEPSGCGNRGKKKKRRFGMSA